MSGQTLNDRLTAARHALAGQGLARIVCKATTEEVIGPKKKHLDYLLHCTNEPNVSIPQLANLLIERTQNASWVVVFKALITVHHLMCYGNERFTQYLASSNCTFQLGCFLDKVGVQSYDMSTFIRRYAKYLNEKAVSYRTVAFDFCKCKRGKEDGILRQMNTEQLLKTLPALQAQLDSLLEFDCSTNDLCNGVVNSCFMLLFRDLVRLFACYNDGIINLLGKYFEMNKKHARDALDIYKKFLIRMDRVAEFLKVAETIGIEKSDIPDLTKAPSSLLEALEQHLATLEGRKGSASAASAAARATNVQHAVRALNHTSLAFCSAGDSPMQEEGGATVDESARRAVEEEAEVMNQLKFDSPLLWEQPTWEDTERRLKEMSGDGVSPPPASAKTNPFLSSPCDGPTTANQKIIDLFSAPPQEEKRTNGTPASEDLLGMGGATNNPFADALFGTKQTTPPKENDTPFGAFTNGFGSDAFASDASFAAAFGDSPTAPASKDSPAAEAALSTPVGEQPPTVTLSLPALEPMGGGRSASPSPTQEMMRGAGTTPILSHAPEGGAFAGDNALSEEAPPHSDVWGGTRVPPEKPPPPVWGGTASPQKPAHPVEDLFGGAAFDLPPPPTASAVPTAVVTPLSVHTPPAETKPPEPQVDLFGFDSDIPDFGSDQPPILAQPVAPPPSPFGGLDFASGAAPDLRAQAIANAVGVAMPMQPPPKPTYTGLEDLDFGLGSGMQAAPPMGLSPVLAASPVGSRPPYMGGAPLYGVPPASSTPGYGTPTSGMSSPARSQTGAPGGFDAFGDTLGAAPKQPEKPSSSFLKGDLDSTLASLASNLDINGPKATAKKGSGHQWGSPKPGVKVAGGWAGGVAPGAPTGMQQGWTASPQHAFQPPMGGVPPAGQWGGGAFPAAAGVFQPPYGMVSDPIHGPNFYKTVAVSLLQLFVVWEEIDGVLSLMYISIDG
ncbi:hypothetical protein JTE90_003715 [Oedothorax gibbosus]|uniref:ENTH domain-containing protein n=1 Tax=Oedothorax gibbosus TaxID=931172 RepID=A0AAV6VCX2_9ARAC|nr:hypothetical protein JTE90_003715 [Oedothorax gibbosus]